MRPIFNGIMAGGVLFYRRRDQLEFLFICKKNRLEDIGGKTEEGDTCIKDTIGREVEEETNHVIQSSIVKRQIKKGKQFLFVKSKYLMVLVKANSYEENLTTESFDHMEYGNGSNGETRTLHWIPLSQVKEMHIHPRIELRTILESFHV